MISRIAIRPATRGDIPALIALAAQAKEAAQWPSQAYEHLFDGDAPPRIALLAENAATEMVGFVVALCAGPEWELENIVVSAGARRRGIGAELLQALLVRAHAGCAQRVCLEVRESNRSARALYQRAGFRQSGRRPGYYLDPVEDAVLYEFCSADPHRPKSGRCGAPSE